MHDAPHEGAATDAGEPLANADARARALFHAVPIPMYAWQRVERDGAIDFVLVDYNRAASDVSRGIVASFVGRAARELPGPHPRLADQFAATLRAGVESRIDVDYTFSTGEEKRFSVTLIPVPPDIVLVHTEDVTQRFALEAQLRHSQKMEAIGLLAGGIAHDFNNLLTVILGGLDLVLARMPETNEHARILREAQAAAARSAELTRQLLAFARKQRIAPRVLDLDREIGATLGLLQRLVGDDIDLAWTARTEPWPVMLDPTQLHQILTNLVVNARDAIDSIGGAGRVTVATENVTVDEAFCAIHPGAEPGDYVALVVSDTGAGMTPEVRARVFEPFFTTKEPGRGTGLGLSSVYGIVSQNGGVIAVESQPGRGTTFRIWLPRAPLDRQPPPLP